MRKTTVLFADARANLFGIIESAVTTHERFEVTRNGERVAVSLNADGFDSLIETVDVLCRDYEIAAIRRGSPSSSLATCRRPMTCGRS